MMNRNLNRLATLAGCIAAVAWTGGCSSEDRGSSPARPMTSIAAPDLAVGSVMADDRLDEIGQRHFAVYTDYLALADQAASPAPEPSASAYSACAADM